jgi:hypothetical protein
MEQKTYTHITILKNLLNKFLPGLSVRDPKIMKINHYLFGRPVKPFSSKNAELTETVEFLKDIVSENNCNDLYELISYFSAQRSKTRRHLINVMAENPDATLDSQTIYKEQVA